MKSPISQYESLLKGLEFALNYHGLDAKNGTADFELAGLLGPQVAHGMDCAVAGVDPAMTPMRESLLIGQLRADRVKLQDENESLRREAQAKVDGWAVANRAVSKLHKRIDQVCEIIGGRIGGLEERLNEFETRTINLLDTHSTDIAALKFPDGEKQDGAAAFPTGAATTAEEVLEQVEEAGQPSDGGPPRRGDRVRLEGALTAGRRPISGWFDVVGHDESEIQIADGLARPWVLRSDPGLKEVRRGAAKLDE